MNLLEKIIYCIQNDGYIDESSKALEEHYEKLGKENKLAIDQVFILMCGYKLETILKGKTIYEKEFSK